MLMSRPGIMRLGKVPSQLILAFEQQILECYGNGYTSLPAITEFVEDFAIYAESHQKTGDPYSYHASRELSPDHLKDIINRNFYELNDDVMTILDFYRMFYIDTDYAAGKYYTNVPLKNIW